MSLLRPWQETSKTALLDVLRRHGAAADMSDGGTGKTYTAVSVAKELDRPTLVVCPKALIPTWNRVGEYLGNESDVLNYEMIRTGRTAYGRFDTGKKSFRWHPELGFLIVDEAHRCAGRNSLQSQFLIAARQQRIPTLILSATLADNPLELGAAGYLLGLHDGFDPRDTLRNFGRIKVSFSDWLRRNGCVWDGTQWLFGGSREQQVANMARIHAQILPEHGVRVRIPELGDQFPTTQISAELYSIDDPSEVNALYYEMQEALEALHTRTLADGDEPVVKLLRARQKVELLKVPIFVEMACDAKSQGQKVVIFVNFARTLHEVCVKLGTNCRVDGSQIGPRGATERQRCVDDFQGGRSPWIVCNCEAGGVGLSLHGKNRLALISPGWSAKVFKQVVMRVHRDGGEHSLQRAICLAGTEEEQVARQLSHKLERLDALNDADFMPAN
jgi:superfamily II DNA or RNA helicase